MQLSQRYADFNNEQSTMLAYLSDGAGAPSAEATRLGVSAAKVTELLTTLAAYSVTYQQYVDPNQHTPKVVHQMKMDYDTSAHFIFPLRQQIKKGEAELTANDYANLFIHVDKETRTPAERPTTAPTVVVLGEKHLNIEYETGEQSTEGVNRVATPAGTQIARELAVTPVGTVSPIPDSEYSSLDIVGRGRFSLMFVNAQVGMIATMRCCYVNTRGEKGPFSVPISTPIV